MFIGNDLVGPSKKCLLTRLALLFLGSLQNFLHDFVFTRTMTIFINEVYICNGLFFPSIVSQAGENWCENLKILVAFRYYNVWSVNITRCELDFSLPSSDLAVNFFVGALSASSSSLLNSTSIVELNLAILVFLVDLPVLPKFRGEWIKAIAI